MESMSTRTKAAIVAGALVLAVGGYLLLQPVPVEEEEKKQPAKRSQSPAKQERPQAKVVELKPDPPKVEVIERPVLSLHQYLDYLRVINETALEKFTALKQAFIRDRRANKDNSEKYEEIVRDFKENEKKVMESSYKEVLENMNIDSLAFEVAREEFLNKHEVATEREKLKKALTAGEAPEELDVERLKVIMETEIQMLADAHSVEDEVKNIQTISRIEDKLFEEFGYEIDQIRGASLKFQSQVKGLSRQILRNFHRFKL